jgi:hypothetical protein
MIIPLDHDKQDMWARIVFNHLSTAPNTSLEEFMKTVHNATLLVDKYSSYFTGIEFASDAEATWFLLKI